jgi:hypothetical protein
MSNNPNQIPQVNTNLPQSTSGTETQGNSTSAFWKLEFYAQFFNVDTVDVLIRMKSAVLPTKNFLDVISANPDLYGII